MNIKRDSYSIDCTGDACVGDTVFFTEGVFGGSYRKPKFLAKLRVNPRPIGRGYKREPRSGSILV